LKPAAHVRFDRVGKRFDDGAEALREVSLSVARGAFCVLLGPSGSGKSTLLRAVNGLTTPTAGEVHVDGVAVAPASLKTIRRQVSMIHQHFGLVERASVAENMMGGALAVIPTWRALAGLYPEPLQRKACELLETVGLKPEHLRRRVGELSGGQRQRVGIARALMLDPEIIIADEPVASLDPRVSEEILSLLRQAARDRGVTVLCSLHQVDLAIAFADQIVALRQGEIVFDGPPAALSRARIAQLYAAQAPGLEPCA
jgi:phosphonate transport system ATP-binding protein